MADCPLESSATEGVLRCPVCGWTIVSSVAPGRIHRACPGPVVVVVVPLPKKIRPIKEPKPPKPPRDLGRPPQTSIRPGANPLSNVLNVNPGANGAVTGGIGTEVKDCGCKKKR